MNNGANYKRGMLHHSPWHSDIRTSNQLNMLQLPETTDRGVDTVRSCNCHCVSFWFHFEALVHSGCVMIAWASQFWMRENKFWRTLRWVGVWAVLDEGLDTLWNIESVCKIPSGAGVLQLLIPSSVVAVFIDCCCVADWVEVLIGVISAMGEMFCNDQGVKIFLQIFEATEHPPWEESLSPACDKTNLITGKAENC
jgi:hypothetical protein